MLRVCMHMVGKQRMQQAHGTMCCTISRLCVHCLMLVSCQVGLLTPQQVLPYTFAVIGMQPYRS